MSNPESIAAEIEGRQPPTLQQVKDWLIAYRAYVLVKFGQMEIHDLDFPPPPDGDERDIEDWIMKFQVFVIEAFATLPAPTTEELEYWLRGPFHFINKRFARLGAPNFPDAGPPPVDPGIGG